MESLVSILIPTYNRGEHLKKAIESVLSQNYKLIEIIISDNNSIDDTAVIVAEFKDERIKYYRNVHNIGPILNWRNAFEKANGEFGILLCDDDYFIDNNYITDAVNLFRKYKSINLVITDCVLGKENPVITRLELDEYICGKSFFDKFWTSNFMIPTISNVFRINSVKILQVWQENEILYSDIELWLKLMLRGNIGYINRPTVFYTFHNNNIVTTMSLEKIIDNAKFIKNICNFMEEEGFLREKILLWRLNFLIRYINFIMMIYGRCIDYQTFRRICIKIGEQPKYHQYFTVLAKYNLYKCIRLIKRVCGEVICLFR